MPAGRHRAEECGSRGAPVRIGPADPHGAFVYSFCRPPVPTPFDRTGVQCDAGLGPGEYAYWHAAEYSIAAERLAPTKKPLSS